MVTHGYRVKVAAILDLNIGVPVVWNFKYRSLIDVCGSSNFQCRAFVGSSMEWSFINGLDLDLARSELFDGGGAVRAKRAEVE